MIFNIFATYTLHGNEYKEILGAGFKMPAATVKALGGKVKALEKLKKDVTHDNLVSAFKKENTMGEVLQSIEIVSSSHGKWVEGEYYAHEYDVFTAGRARLVTYSNKFTEYEVQCLDKSKKVLDGIWSCDDGSDSRLENGCGDHFTPVRALK